MSPSVDQVFAELRALAGAVGAFVPAEALAELRPLAERYAELTVAPGLVEIVVGGPPDALARAARQLGAGEAAVVAFLACAEAFGASAYGLKVGFGAGAQAPSLYARLLVDKAAGLAFVGRLFPVEALAERFKDHRVLYGLGFQGDPVVVKTYALEGHGFVSWRLDEAGLRDDLKEYRAEDPVGEAEGDWGRVLRFVTRDLGWAVAGHSSVRVREGGVVEPKLYFERIGAIATDWTAR